MLIKIDTWEIGCKGQGRKDGFLCSTFVCISKTEFEISHFNLFKDLNPYCFANSDDIQIKGIRDD